MTHILLAHAPETAARARLVAAKLGALGLEVRQRPRARGPIAHRRLVSAVDDAACVVLVGPSADPVLRATARRARIAGKPAHWTGRDDTRTWRRLAASVQTLAVAPTPAKKALGPSSVTDGVLVLGFVALFLALCAGAYYLLPQHV